jgi:hypothetical protein
MVDLLAFGGETGGFVGHQASTLGFSNDGAQVGLSTVAKLAVAAFRNVPARMRRILNLKHIRKLSNCRFHYSQRNNDITRHNGCNTFTNTFDDTSTYI